MNDWIESDEFDVTAHRLPASVLFCCTQNAIRSPMAEGLLKAMHGQQIYVDSVGVREGDINPFVIVVASEFGIDLSRHRSKTFDELQDTSFDLIISMSPEAQHSAVELTRTMACDVEYWPIMDPTFLEGSRDAMLVAFRQTRDQIYQRLQRRFPDGVSLGAVGNSGGI